LLAPGVKIQASGISCLERLARGDEIVILAGCGCAGENQEQEAG